LHVDLLGILLLLNFHFHIGDEVFLHQVEAVEFFNGNEIVEVLKLEVMYIVQIFFSLENGLFGLVGGSEQLPAWEFREYDVEFEFVDQFFEIIMEALELAVAQFGDFGASSLFVSDLQHVDYLPVALRLVVDDLRLQVHHQLLID
jgi:hypothetical protein